MANVIQIKRSAATATPASLNEGELAFSFNSNTLFIGNSTSGVVEIGGGKYVAFLNGTAGTLTASKAVIVDANQLINTFKIGNSVSNTTFTNTAIVLANSTVNTQISIPSAAQWTGGNYYLNANGSWTTVTGATANPAGTDTQVQFNDGGSTMGASAGFTFAKTTNNVFIGNTLTAETGVRIGTGTANSVAATTSYTLQSNATVNTVIGSTNITVQNSTGSSVMNATSITSPLHVSGTGTANSFVNTTAVVVQSNATVNTTILGTGLTVANSTGTTTILPISVQSAAHLAGAGTANAFINTTAVVVQSNATVNTTILGTGLTVANSTGTTGQTPLMHYAGSGTANAFINTTAIVVQSNATVNTTILGTQFSVANSTGTTTVLPVSITSPSHFAGTSTANAFINTTAIVVQSNSTVNTTILGTQITLANSTGTTTITPTTFSNPTSVTSAVFYGGTGTANAFINTTAIVVQSNATVNTTILGTQITVANSTGTATLTPLQLSVRDIAITGNLTVNGTTTLVNGTTVATVDSMIKLAANNGAGDTLDIGIYGRYWNGAADRYTGLTRTASDGKWRLWTSEATEPTTTATTGTLATLAVGTLELTNVLGYNYGGTGLSSFTNKGVMVGTSGTTLGFVTGSAGHVLQLDGSAVPVFGVLDGGSF